MLPSIVHRLAKDLLPPIILERPLDVGLALFTVALTYLIAKLALRESRDTIFFSVAFPPVRRGPISVLGPKITTECMPAENTGEFARLEGRQARTAVAVVPPRGRVASPCLQLAVF